jgi:hypothetical protein
VVVVVVVVVVVSGTVEVVVVDRVSVLRVTILLQADETTLDGNGSQGGISQAPPPPPPPPLPPSLPPPPRLSKPLGAVNWNVVEVEVILLVKFRESGYLDIRKKLTM